MADKNEGLGAVVEKYMRRFYAGSDDEVCPVGVYDFVMGEVERRLIAATLEYAKGNRLKTAKILGINRNTLLRKMRDFGLDAKRDGK